MSKVLIGVGGSGQHIVHAYLRVLALGNAGATEVPHVYIIDADALDTIDNDSKLIPDIEEVHDYLNKRTNATHEPTNFSIIPPYNQGLDTNNNLRVRDVLTATRVNTAAELSAFFYDTDLNIKVSEGMHANPKIGSTIFGEKLGTVLNEDNVVNPLDNPKLLEEEFSTLFDSEVTGKNADDVQIVIVGSVFGGTGSGIIPTLARTFSDILEENKSVSISTVTTLPWFNLVGPVDGSAKDTNKLKRNTTFALKNFSHELQDKPANKVKSIFIQSGDKWAEINRNSAGDFDQPEHKHVINLKAANAVQHCFANDLADNKMYMPLSNQKSEVNLGQYHPHLSKFLQFIDFQQDNSYASLWTLQVRNLLTTMVLQALNTILDSYNQGKFKHDYITEGSDYPYAGLSKLLENITNKFNIDFEKKVNRFKSDKVFVSKDIADNLKTSLNNELNNYNKTLHWLYKHDREDDDLSGIIPIFQRYVNLMLEGDEHTNELISELLQKNDKTDFNENEHWVSFSLKMINKLLFGNNNGNGNDLNEDIKLKIEAIANKGDYDALARSIASLIYKNMASCMETASFPPPDLLNGYKEIGQVYLPVTLVADSIEHFGTIKWDGELTNEFAKIDEMDIRHPRTLHWLDALRKIKITNGNEVDRRGIKIDETIAQGVPNILSSFLIQKWRIQPENNTVNNISGTIRNAKVNDIYKIHEDKNFFSTRFGLYLYAQRVNEAAFWLLINNQSGIKYTVLNLDNNDPYKRWLHTEQDNQDWLHDTIGMIVTDSDDKTPLFLWNGYFWCLASNNEAQSYFSNMLTSDTDKLPTIRYFYHTEDIFTRSDIANADAIDADERFFVDRLTALKQRLEKNSHNNPRPNENILHILITGILTDLPLATNDSIKVSPLETPLQMGTQGPKNLDEIGTNAAMVEISQYLISNPRVIMLDKEVDDVNSILTIGQFLPITKEYWKDNTGIMDKILADGNDTLHTQLCFDNSGINCTVKYTNLYNAPAKCWQKFETYSEDPILSLSAYDLTFGLGVWPDFKAAGWKYYMLTADLIKTVNIFRTDTANALRARFGTDELMLTVYSQDLSEKVDFGFDAVPTKVNFVPAIVELSCGNTVIGTQPITLRNLDGVGGSVESMGLDFGTSNTCMAVAYKDDNGNMTHSNINLANTEKQPIQEWSVFSHPSNTAAMNTWLQYRGAFYLQRQAEVNESLSYTMPSEMIIGLSLRDHDIYDDDEYTGQDKTQLDYLRDTLNPHSAAIQGINPSAPIFSPLCSDFSGFYKTDADRTAILANIVMRPFITRIYGNIKWPNSTLGDAANATTLLRKIYIEQIIVAAFARLREERNMTKVDYFYATRPDAFLFEHGVFARGYIDDVEAILTKLQSETGISIKKNKVVEVSETKAAIQVTRTRDTMSYVVVDVGGGTTDIDINLRYIDNEGKRNRAKYSSSIRWAGNDLLSAFLKPKTSAIRNILREDIGVNNIDNANAQILMESLFKRMIRNNQRIVDTMGASPEPISKVAQMFFESIYEYIFVKIKLLLQANGMESANCLDKEMITIVLQGNGFKLSEYFSHRSYPHRKLNNVEKHFAQSVWSSVFPDAENINLEVEFGEHSKEDMITKGAGTVAFGLQEIDDDGDKLTDQKIIYPAKIFDEEAEQPQICQYSQDLNLPSIAEDYRDQDDIQEILTELFPYTKKYWEKDDANRVARLFTTHARGNRHFHDINAMYLKGSGSGNDNWNFFIAMTEALGNGA